MLATRTPTNADVKAYLPVVRGVVRSVRERVPNLTDRECLEGAAMVGLLQAFAGFDPDKGVAFAAYAKIRIRGAVQDELRALDHLTRRQRRRVRAVATARKEIEASGETAHNDEIATSANLTVDQVEAANCLATPASYDPMTLGELAVESPWQQATSIEEQVIAKQQRDLLERALAELPERDQTIMSLYYKEELTLQEIGEMFDITQSRVSQIISKVKTKLKKKLAAE